MHVWSPSVIHHSASNCYEHNIELIYQNNNGVIMRLETARKSVLKPLTMSSKRLQKIFLKYFSLKKMRPRTSMIKSLKATHETVLFTNYPPT